MCNGPHPRLHPRPSLEYAIPPSTETHRFVQSPTSPALSSSLFCHSPYLHFPDTPLAATSSRTIWITAHQPHLFYPNPFIRYPVYPFDIKRRSAQRAISRYVNPLFTLTLFKGTFLLSLLLPQRRELQGKAIKRWQRRRLWWG